MHRFLFVVAAMFMLACIVQSMDARRRSTTRRPLKQTFGLTGDESLRDTAWVWTDSVVICGEKSDSTVAECPVRFCGYEKTLRANDETLFIENKSDMELSRVIFTIYYIDNSGRAIHRRSLDLNCDIPAGDIRRVDFRSWDRQKTYYYLRGSKPRVSATPYDVRVQADSLYFLVNKSLIPDSEKP